MKILIIEDEAALAKSISDYLSEENYICEFAETFAMALEKVENYSYDCILLDLMLPDGSGMDILEMLKKQGKEEGLIIISAKDALDDKIKALQIGADDYLTKPFHLQELAARIFSIIRRKQFGNNNIIQQNELYIDLLAKTILINENPITLTKRNSISLFTSLAIKTKSFLKVHLPSIYQEILPTCWTTMTLYMRTLKTSKRNYLKAVAAII